MVELDAEGPLEFAKDKIRITQAELNKLCQEQEQTPSSKVIHSLVVESVVQGVELQDNEGNENEKDEEDENDKDGEYTPSTSSHR